MSIAPNLPNLPNLPRLARRCAHAACALLFALAANAHEAPPPGLSAAEWQAIEDEIRAEIAAEDAAAASQTVQYTGSGSDAWVELDRLAADLSGPVTPDDDVRYGNAVAIDGDRLVVGAAARMHPNGFRAGAAFFYQRGGGAWQQTQRILFAETSNARCGWSVALLGRHVVIGCPYYDAEDLPGFHHGRTLIYSRNDAGQYVNPHAFIGNHAAEQCGYKVAIGGSGQIQETFVATTCIWRPRDGFLHGASGEVDVYRLIFTAPSLPSVWTPETTLTSSLPTPVAGDRNFGEGLAVHRDAGGTVRIAVGMPERHQSATPRAYMFRRESAGTWSVEAQRTPPAGSPHRSDFGHSVALDGIHWIVGAPGDGQGPDTPGRVYAYRRTLNSWSAGLTIAPPSSALPGLQNDSRFGHEVALSGAELWVGQPYWLHINDKTAPTVGRALRYLRTGSGLGTPLAYSLTQTLSPGQDDWQENSEFGLSIAVDAASGRAVIGAPLAVPIGEPDVQWHGRAVVYGRGSDIFGSGFE